jgi:hypothetical protein
MASVRSVLVTLGAAAAATVLATSTASAAGATLVYSGGGDVAVGDTLSASSSSVTLSTSSGDITCDSSTFSGPVTANPASPGTATVSVQSFTIGGTCDSSVTGVTGVKSIIAGGLPYTASVSSSGSAAISGSISTTANLSSLLGSVSCTYTGSSLSGTASGNTISFSNQPFSLSSGSALCPSSASFTASYSPVTGPGGNVTLG